MNLLISETGRFGEVCNGRSGVVGPAAAPAAEVVKGVLFVIMVAGVVVAVVVLVKVDVVVVVVIVVTVVLVAGAVVPDGHTSTAGATVCL